MVPSILQQIEHYQRHGSLLLATRRPLADPQLALQRIRQSYDESMAHSGPGFLHRHAQGWEHFCTHNRRLRLRYGDYQGDRGRLLEIQQAPDGTTLLRVTCVNPPDCFQQRLYCSCFHC